MVQKFSFVVVSMFLTLSVFGKEIGSAVQKRLTTLNYPALPAETQEFVRTGKRPLLQPLRMDNMLAQDWALQNIGFFESFTPLIQPIKSGVESCSSKITVAVIDTGIDYTHPELKDNLWTNIGESGPWTPSGTAVTDCRDKSCNGIDDDGNGFVDDVVGWDFVHEVPLPFDTHGHGSHIAGIIASSAANGFGTTGICPRVSIMALKYYDNSGIGYNNLQNTVRAIQYAIRMGAKIINYSGGGSDPALNERIAVENAEKHGVLFVAAAGNDGHNNDLQPYYPASYGLSNIISVASITQSNQLLPSSNFGKTVYIAAPGLSVLSTLPGGRFGTMSGTSQATAFVTGAAALLASQAKDVKHFDYAQIKAWIGQGAKPMRGNDSRTVLATGLLSIPGSLKIAVKEPKKAVPPAIALTIGAKPTKKSQ